MKPACSGTNDATYTECPVSSAIHMKNVLADSCQYHVYITHLRQFLSEEEKGSDIDTPASEIKLR